MGTAVRCTCGHLQLVERYERDPRTFRFFLGDLWEGGYSRSVGPYKRRVSVYLVLALAFGLEGEKRGTSVAVAVSR